MVAPKNNAEHTASMNPQRGGFFSSSDVRQPMHLSTTFRKGFQGTDQGGLSEYIYSRIGNPNRDHLEKELAKLEGGSSALAFASGLAASMSVFQLLRPESKVLIPDQCYWGTKVQLAKLFSPMGILVDPVDMSDLRLLQSKITPEVAMVFVETPSNPMMRVTDLKAVAALGKIHGIITVCDNTVPTGFLQRPLDSGFDLVVFSTSKAVNGHSDVIGGAVVVGGRKDLYEKLKIIQHFGGAVLSPHDCWLTMRGLLTLPLRIEAQCRTAEYMVPFFHNHPQVKKVYYPFDPKHPQYDLARDQMKRGGGLMSIELVSRKAALNFLSKLRIALNATSLGGVETTAEHRASVEKDNPEISDGLIRISFGIEERDALEKDFSEALKVAVLD